MVRSRTKFAIVSLCTLAIAVVLGTVGILTSKASVLRTAECDISAEHEISALSQNLRLTAVFDDGWDNFVMNRYGRVETLCNNYDADIKCFQEADYMWRLKLNAMFNEDEYYRNYYKNSKGLANPIYVKKSKFDMIDSGNFIVSEEYEREVTKDGETKMVKYESRIATWVKVKDKNTGKTLTMVNTHLAFHEDVQIASCTKIMNFVAKAGTDGYLICGDFNFNMHKTKRYNVMLQNGTKDMAIAATKEGKTGVMTYTCHGFGNAPKMERIDFFFGSKNLTSKMYTVVNDLIDGQYASDHYGILTYIDIN